jgi:hypothetical protein
MSEINIRTQNELAEEILHQFRVLSELLQDNPQAYKLCYEVNAHFIKFSENAHMLAANNQQMSIPNIGGY